MGKKSNPFQSAKTGGPNVARILPINQSYDQSLNTLESLLTPLQGGQYGTRLQSDLTRTREAALAGDPLLASYYNTVNQGLQQGGYGLDPDFEHNLLQDVRGSQAARGTLTSDTSAVEEAVRLLGGREQLRNQRISQANQLLTSGVLPGVSSFMPTASDLLSAQIGLQQLNLNRGLGKAGQFNDRMNSIAGNSNQTVQTIKGGGGSLGGI